MTDAANPANPAAEQVTAGTQGAFGMGDMLEVNTGGS